MQVSVETISNLERRLTIGVPSANIDNAVNARLKDAQKNIKMNGFRKGKVPLKIVKQQYGPGVRQEVLGDVINKSFYEALTQENLKPAGQPSIEPKQVEEGKDFEFIATFEVYPEVEVGDLSAVSVQKLEAEVTDADLDSMIEVLRKQQATFESADRAAALEDQVDIDFVGTKDGEEFAGGKADSQKLVLGSNSMIPGFEDGIVGMKAGEQKTLQLTFPEDYHSEDLKGAAVEFAITLNGVEEQKLPELNEEFFVKYGVSEGGEEKFREEVKGNMVREMTHAAKTKLKTQVMNNLREIHNVELPKALITSEIDVIRNQMAQQFGGAQNMDIKSLLPDDMFREQAEQRVALGVIVGELIKKADLKPDADRVRSQIEEMASTYEQPEEVIDYYYNNQQMLAQVESLVIEDQVVDYVIEQGSIETVKSTYDEIIKPEEPAAQG
ncbi:MAG: trigger factor [Cellvibrionaceae bacterium]